MASSVTSSCYDDAVAEVANEPEEEEEEEEEEEDIYGPPTNHIPPTVRVVAGLDAPDDNHVDNYEMLDDVDDSDFTLSEKMVTYVGGHIMKFHWTSCKAHLVFHAGAYVSKLPTMTKAKCHDATLETYNIAVTALDPLHFGVDATVFFRHSFRDKTKPIN